MNPKSLKPHPVLGMLPRVPEELPATQAFLDDVKAHGIYEPVLVIAGTSTYIDGRRRVEAARQLEVDVPTFEIPEDEAIAAILSTLTQRRHLTKGQLAYVSYPLLQPALEEAKARRLAILKSGGSIPDSVGYAQNKTEIARSLGFSVDLIEQAQQIHDAIEDDESLQSFVEEQIFIQGHGLGAIKAGLAGRKATKGNQRGHQLIFDFSKAANAANTFVNRWSKPEIWDDGHISKTREALEEAFAHLPTPALDEIEKTIKRLKKAVAG